MVWFTYNIIKGPFPVLLSKHNCFKNLFLTVWNGLSCDKPWPCCMRIISKSYTMGCPPLRGDNPRALASGLSYVQVDKHGVTFLYHLDQCRPCTSRDCSC